MLDYQIVSRMACMQAFVTPRVVSKSRRNRTIFYTILYIITLEKLLSTRLVINSIDLIKTGFGSLNISSCFSV